MSFGKRDFGRWSIEALREGVGAIATSTAQLQLRVESPGARITRHPHTIQTSYRGLHTSGASEDEDNRVRLVGGNLHMDWEVCLTKAVWPAKYRDKNKIVCVLVD